MSSFVLLFSFPYKYPPPFHTHSSVFSNISPMPQEIIDMVIDNVVDRPVSYSYQNKRALALCSLVCKSRVPRTRHHLFCVLDYSIASFVSLLRSDKCTFLSVRARRLRVSHVPRSERPLL
ncbi:hypothetical protein K438DRAFT_1821516 [Mycena galopus ATCC 62051]|nr:hypothetical protein K438DRAFT_1821516 [Mycena galopus ATCC 62051]